MLKILVVDDNAEKVRRVLDVVGKVAGVEADAIDVVYNARDARARLTEKAYDLMILDIALPDWADSSPEQNGGIALLKEVCERSKYTKPKHILGLTAYPEALLQAAPEFQQELWHIVQYDTTAMDWIEQLQRKIKYLLLAATDKRSVEYGCDLCIVTALQVPENAAVLDLPWDWKLIDLPSEVAIFHSGSFVTSGKSRRAVLGCATRMGMTAAAIVSMKAIYNFRPRFLAMVGIAAGIRGECNLGDIVVADPTWDYGSGRWSARGSETVFEMAPHHLSLNAMLRSRFQLMSQDSALLDGIRSQWRGPKPDTTLRLVIGPAASGSAVRADGNVARDVKAQHRKTVSIEMEAYGVMAAAHEAPLPEVKAFVVKSICDFADEKKTDEFQAYAAHTSAAILKAFAENYLPTD
jgi:nucleoside phosphorylase/CheY-like chemotaxis protein